MRIMHGFKIDESKEGIQEGALTMRRLVTKVDIVAILVLLAGIFWGIIQRSRLSAVPLWTGDTWGYLNPALSWLSGEGFEQTNGREWLYPAIIFVTLKLSGISGIVRLQQCVSLLAAPLLWQGVRLWLSIFPRRSTFSHSVGVLLGAIAASVYVLGTTQILHELTIGPEGVLSFFVVVSLVCALGYFRARWVTHRRRFAVAFGAGTVLLCYADILLKPSWSLAFLPVSCLLIVGMVGSGSRRLRFGPAAAGLIMLGAAWALPYLLGFKRDSASRTFLPFTLVSIHAAQIVENAERHNLLGDGVVGSNHLERRFYRALERCYEVARSQPLTTRTLGFDADYIMYAGRFFSSFQSEQQLTDEELIKLCYEAYFRLWRESPDLMIAKIASELRLFLTAPRQDFAAYTLTRNQFLKSVASGSSVEQSITRAKASGYLNQPFFASYMDHLEEIYAEGLEVHRVNVQQRYLALLFSKLSPLIQAAFFVAFLSVITCQYFLDLRLWGWAAALVGALLYGNVLTISIVHTLDLDRYRTSYAPALLLALVLMTVFVLGCCERLFWLLVSVLSPERRKAFREQ